jgi:hypothetical protein
LLALPSNTLIRDWTVIEPAAGYGGRQRAPPWQRVDRWCAGVPEAAWQTVDVRDSERGPVQVQAVWRLVQARCDGRVGDVAEILVVFREQQGDGSFKHDYLLSNAELGTPVAEFARVFKAQHRVEECLQRAKGEAGLADYEVRSWRGWYHHQVLALTATWFYPVNGAGPIITTLDAEAGRYYPSSPSSSSAHSPANSDSIQFCTAGPSASRP